ncbi:hypothetical protein BLNAU_11631 [Blattamonas nauphoetae]|uniref:Uncharacterized protein n=1 Tax=Blattamonas nauphoetae TaxID=2049346 RepID=A0ABQ9XLQ4_9EUKA|nr:hypothetical protein BLNAU_11631 [Blattamonas nauphoetae]
MNSNDSRWMDEMWPNTRNPSTQLNPLPFTESTARDSNRPLPILPSQHPSTTTLNPPNHHSTRRRIISTTPLFSPNVTIPNFPNPSDETLSTIRSAVTNPQPISLSRLRRQGLSNLLQLLHWSGFHKCNLSSLRFNTLPSHKSHRIAIVPLNPLSTPACPSRRSSYFDICLFDISESVSSSNPLITTSNRVTCAFPSSDACHRTTAFNSPCPPIPIKPPTVPSKPLFLSVTSKLTSSDLLHHHNEAIEPLADVVEGKNVTFSDKSPFSTVHNDTSISLALPVENDDRTYSFLVEHSTEGT